MTSSRSGKPAVSTDKLKVVKRSGGAEEAAMARVAYDPAARAIRCRPANRF
jgi:hypothetical protein